MLYFFTSKLRHSLIDPVWSRFMSILGYGPKEKQQPTSWYDRRFGSSNPKWYSKFNFVKNTKDKVVQKLIMFFGGLFFIYIFAKAIPSSIRRYSL